MVTDLILPKRGIESLELPSYVKLDLALGLGAGTTLFDKSRYRSHGTISGASWAAGLHGYALDFNPATPSYVEIAATHTQLDFTSEDFSFIFRCYFDDLSTAPMLICRHKWNNKGYYFNVEDTGRITFRTSNTSYQETKSTAGDITTESWVTIGLSRVGAAVTLYKNGVALSKTVSQTHINPVTLDDKAYIGIYQTKTSGKLDGKMEFLRIIGGIALSASEHLAYHNALK